MSGNSSSGGTAAAPHHVVLPPTTGKFPTIPRDLGTVGGAVAGAAGSAVVTSIEHALGTYGGRSLGSWLAEAAIWAALVGAGLVLVLLGIGRLTGTDPAGAIRRSASPVKDAAIAAA